MAQANEVHRFSVNFPPGIYQALQELADGGSLSDALRDAILLSKWFKDTREHGGTILVERDGKIREVVKI